MFVIWRGYGILVILAAVVGGAIGIFLSLALGSAGLELSGPFTSVLVGLGATAVCYGTTIMLESLDKGRVVIDKKTGQELTLRRGDSLFFIPVRWWTYALGALTVVLLVVAIVNAVRGT